MCPAPIMTVHGAARPKLILGVAEDMCWEQLRPFVESLGRTSFDGELRLFVAGLDASTIRRLEDEGVRLEHVRRLRFERRGRVFHPHDPPLRRFRASRVTRAYPWLIRALAIPTRDRLRTRCRLAAPLSFPHVARFLRYYDYLSRPGASYDAVMLTDVRDVFFQRDPFDFDIGASVHCFLEHPHETLGSQKHNRGWLLAAFGEDVLRELEDRPISCSGVTIGAGAAVLGYLRVLVDLLLGIPRQQGGIDQAAHNYAVHRGLVPDLELVANDGGPVTNLAIVPEAEVLAALPDGYSHVNVLHQYDRHPQLAEMLLSRLD